VPAADFRQAADCQRHPARRVVDGTQAQGESLRVRLFALGQPALHDLGVTADHGQHVVQFVDQRSEKLVVGAIALGHRWCPSAWLGARRRFASNPWLRNADAVVGDNERRRDRLAGADI
jgi:hypothetical protein